MTTVSTQSTTIGRGDAASPEVFAAVGQLISISEIGFERTKIDVTNLASAAREYNVAIKDPKEMSLVFQYDTDDAGQTGLRTDLNAGTARNFEVTLQDSSPLTVYSFTARVTSWVIGVEIDNIITLNVTLAPTGDISIA